MAIIYSTKNFDIEEKRKQRYPLANADKNRHSEWGL
jgi:hypothetical protein